MMSRMSLSYDIRLTGFSRKRRTDSKTETLTCELDVRNRGSVGSVHHTKLLTLAATRHGTCIYTTSAKIGHRKRCFADMLT